MTRAPIVGRMCYSLVNSRPKMALSPNDIGSCRIRPCRGGLAPVCKSASTSRSTGRAPLLGSDAGQLLCRFWRVLWTGHSRGRHRLRRRYDSVLGRYLAPMGSGRENASSTCCWARYHGFVMTPKVTVRQGKALSATSTSREKWPKRTKGSAVASPARDTRSVWAQRTCAWTVELRRKNRAKRH